jgi:predicted glycogen debranching enzyme
VAAETPALPQLRLGRATCSEADLALDREWLVTNGIGGYASGTVGLANTRRYHGLLVAALAPPVGRTVLVAGLDVTARYAGREFALCANEYGGGTLHPRGFLHVESFTLDGGVPTWRFVLAGARIARRVWMAHGENTTHVEYAVEAADGPVEIELAPLVTHRDYHAHARGAWGIRARPVGDGVEVVAFDRARPYRLLAQGARFEPASDWYWNFRHRVEAARGLDDGEDLFCPGRFSRRLAPGESLVLTCTAEAAPRPAAAALAEARMRALDLVGRLPRHAPEWVRQLALAADQFVVARGATGDGTTVIAGYPWFTDWGRDTMIALPGLATAAGRPEIAAGVIRTFARHVSEGMLPNRFPDGGEPPEYNTVDATLWYFQAVADHVAATGNLGLARELLPQLADIVAWHRRGTRYGIGVDPADGLLRAGVPGVQLTWMDAKVGDWVVTPRLGKPVEINALWANALAVLAALAAQLGEDAVAREHRALADRAAAAFRRRFWCGSAGHLYDVVDGPGGDDATLRPNQLFAVSLPEPLLDAAQARAVVDRCARELATSVGLRSLAPGSAGYAGRYEGGSRERDGAYHQGTAWSWLLGPFALAHFRVHGDRDAALAWLAPVRDHLLEGCVGSVSEIFDGDAPHRPRGCFAQAWSVAEVLRAWRALAMPEHEGATP